MPTGAQHWSKEPGRWEASLAPEAWATIPRIQAPLVSPDGARDSSSSASTICSFSPQACAGTSRAGTSR